MEAARRNISPILDAGPVVALTFAALATGRSENRATLFATLALVVVPLIARRFWPLPVLVVVAFGSVVTATHLGNPWVQISAVALASLTLGDAWPDRPRAVVIVLGVAGAMTVGFLVQDADPFLSVTLPFVVLLPSWLVGDAVRQRRMAAQATAQAAAEATERAIRERDARVRDATAEERRRVARELHDIVAHTVSVMQVQAGAARQVIRTSPDDAEASLLAVEATGREAMAELRSLLGVLDDDRAGTGPGLAPEPGVGQLDGLVDRVRQAGLPAEIEIDGQPRPLPAGLDVTVYRIIQEALTNALRYARDAKTLVHLTFESGQLRIEVLDDGPTGPTESLGGSVDGSGRGIVGMRERAVHAGGRLEAGPRLGGGYAVRAWLPLDSRPADTRP
jgi:signal transduction histidine kinase